MSQYWRKSAFVTLILTLVACAQSEAASGIYPVGFYLSCGARLGLCLPACDSVAPAGIFLGRCYDRCSIGAGICEASRIPVPGRSIRH
jgi:hypothetical protein